MGGRPDVWRNWLSGRDPDHDDVRCEEAGSHDEDPETLLARDPNQFAKASYRKFLRALPRVVSAEEG